MDANIKLPGALIDAVARGEVALFFGAGASKGAVAPAGTPASPTGLQLRDLICDEFLRGDCKERSLDEVASFVENERGPLALENYIAKLIGVYRPGKGHLLLPEFHWQGLFSLNYDLLIERAYDARSDREQVLRVFYKNEQSIDKTLRETSNSIGLFKLHGSIDSIHDRDAPIVLSQDGYIKWDQERARLYSRLEDSIAEYHVVFLGTTLADPHIRKILYDASGRRPMQYLVSPTLNTHDNALLSARRITPIPTTFDEFMQALNEALPRSNRRLQALVASPDSHSIKRHFRTKAEPPASLVAFLTDNVEHVRAGMASTAVSAELFYKGESQSWSPIEQGFDIARPVYEPLMLKAISLQAQAEPSVDILALRGVAGAGKTVLLRRIAYDLATTYGHLVLFAPQRANLRAEPLRELFEQTGLRVILAIDQVADQMASLVDLVGRLEASGVPITLLVADTQASLGASLDDLEENVRFTYDLKRLNENEIRSLISKLAQHKCLGVLEHATPEERFNSFNALADRQLLVALYEATQGKPLEDIILEEYERILLNEAQEIYLIVCTLNQYKTPVRAGLVRRLTGIDFNEFESKFLGPLSEVVFTQKDPSSGDRSYRARHSHIAQIVFKKVLDTNSKRVGQFLRIIGQMDTSYSSDLDAMRQMINYRNLRDIAPAIRDRRQILDVAEQATGSEVFVLHQRALVEMNDARGDISAAKRYLDEAQAKRPYDRALKHTRATLLAREARAMTNDLTRKVARSEARAILRNLSSSASDPYVLGLTAQIAIDELEENIGIADGAQALEAPILRLIEDAERALREGLSRAPDFESLTLLESRLRELIGQNARAISTLQRTIQAQPQLEFVAIAYARAIKKTQLEEALSVIRKSLVHKPYSRPLNQMLFELELEKCDDARDELAVPLQRSFTSDDGNLAMHVHALRFYFLRSDRESFEAARAVAKKLRLPGFEKAAPRFAYRNPSVPDGRHAGTMTAVGEAYGYARVGGMLETVFVRPGASIEAEAWDQLTRGSRVSLELCFNAYGAIAANMKLLG